VIEFGRRTGTCTSKESAGPTVGGGSFESGSTDGWQSDGLAESIRHRTSGVVQQQSRTNKVACEDARH
jgi:hypothetical protein